VRVYVNVCVYVYVYVCVCVRACMYICTYVSTTFDVDELLLGQRLAVHRVGSVLRDVLLDEPPLEHLVGHGGDARVLRDLVGDCGPASTRELVSE